MDDGTLTLTCIIDGENDQLIVRAFPHYALPDGVYIGQVHTEGDTTVCNSVIVSAEALIAAVRQVMNQA